MNTDGTFGKMTLLQKKNKMNHLNLQVAKDIRYKIFRRVVFKTCTVQVKAAKKYSRHVRQLHLWYIDIWEAGFTHIINWVWESFGRHLTLEFGIKLANPENLVNHNFVILYSSDYLQ